MDNAGQAQTDIDDGIKLVIRGIDAGPRLAYASSSDSPLHDALNAIIQGIRPVKHYGISLPVTLVAYRNGDDCFVRYDDGVEKHPLSCNLDDLSDLIRGIAEDPELA